MSSTKKVLFVHNALRTFVRIDRDLLREKYEVHEIDYRLRIKPIAQITHILPKCDIIYIWFASHHAFLAVTLGKIFRKKVIICSSDYDLANEPAWSYGSMRGGLSKTVNNIIFRLADHIIVPSMFSRNLAFENTILANFPEKVHVIPHGIAKQSMPTVTKMRRVTTVGSIKHPLTVWRKGLDTFVKMAKFIPDIECTLIGDIGNTGGTVNYIQKMATQNVSFTNRITDIDRDLLLATSAAYAQLSYMEGFGLSVIEAMMQNCVPVVTERGALPEVVGDCGVYVPYADPSAAAKGVQEALHRPELGLLARERVLELFSLERRKELLMKVMCE